MMAISWFAIVIVIFVAAMLVKGIINPGTRPYVIGLGAVMGAGVVVLFFLLHAVGIRQSPMPVQVPQMLPHGVASPPTVAHSYGQLTAEVKAPPGVQSGTLRMEYWLFDNQARDCSIDVTYSPDRGKTWFPATEAAGGIGISGLNSSQFGSPHEFFWDSLADLGAVRNPNVEIRVAPVSGSNAGTPATTNAGAPGASSFFVVDNRRLASQVSKATAPLPPAAPQKADLFSALGKAVFQAWTSSASTSRTSVAEKTSKSPSAHPLPLSQREKRGLSPPVGRDAAKPQPPAWVNAAPQQQGDVYLMTLHVGPFTTLLECERDLPKALQAAVAEYADLLLGHSGAQVSMPDDMLQATLVRQRWEEKRPIEIEIDGAKQDMVVLHVQIGFDPAMQRQIRYLAEHAAQSATIYQRLKIMGLALGGLFGLLALAWGGLSAMTRRQETSRDTTSVEELTPAIAAKRHRFSVLLVVGVLATIAFLAFLAAFWLAAGVPPTVIR